MIRAWSSAGIRPLIVTDFDSLTSGGERAIVRGIREAGYALTKESQFLKEVDDAVDKDEAAYVSVATNATDFFKSAGIDVFVFTSDLEYALITDANKTVAAGILSSLDGKKDYSKGYTLPQLRRVIGSKTIPIDANNDPPFKKPFIHKKIAEQTNLASAHPDIGRLLNLIESL